MPCAAPAAFASSRRVNVFTPSRSATENIIVTSFTSTYDDTSPDATVDTMTFGNPYGSVRSTCEHSAVPCNPPSPIAA